MALELLRVDPATAEDPASLADPTYFGYATPGTLDTEAKWSIKKRVIVSGVTQYQYPYITGSTMAETYPAIAVNNTTYLQASGLIWEQRTGYTYQ
jgi:hypothetical protein